MGYKPLAIRIIAALLFLPFGAPMAENLNLVRALPIEGPSSLQPSGLAVCQGRLLMVSDRHNRAVFELVEGEQATRLETFRTLDKIPAPNLDAYGSGLRWFNPLTPHFDWKGLACDDQGSLYLLSEALVQVLRVAPDGEATWLTKGAYGAGREKGLFEQTNAFAEGLALSPSRAYIAAERQPRGLVTLDTERTGWPPLGAQRLNPFPSLVRPLDFSGLLLDGDHLYTLERSNFQVCRRTLAAFEREACWNYRHVEEAPEYRYQDRRFGKAEGIARRGDLLYLVLDNNEGAKEAAPDDRRPWLFVFELPSNW